MSDLEYVAEYETEFSSESIENILHTCEEAINRITFCENTRFRLKFSLEELVVNSIEHGYQSAQGVISISIKKKDRCIVLSVCDLGKGFNPSKLNSNTNFTSIEEIKSRGWGLSIISKLAESIKVESNGNKGTKVSIVFYEDPM